MSTIGEHGLLRRPRYIHRSSRRKFIYHRHSNHCAPYPRFASKIPALWSVTGAHWRRHQNTVALDTCNTAECGFRGADWTVLRPLQRHVVPPMVKIELFNTQSMSKKASFLQEHILENGLDLLCLTETWHEPEVFYTLNESCPPGYSYFEKARSTGRGGGLAAIHSQDLELSSIPLPVLSTFECLAFKCKPPLSLTFLLVYRPPKPNSAFLLEFQDLLSTLYTTSANIMILGDFNIHVDTPSCHSAAEFLHLLDSLNLQQHVDAPTHSKGHTLDLVISSYVPIKKLQVRDLGLSDHKAIYMELPFSYSSHCKPERQINFRSIKNIDPDALALDLQHISCDPTTFSSVTETVDFYNHSLSSLLDHHAPIRTRTVTFARSAPWYTSELRRMKSAGRILERCFKASGLTVHMQAYREHQKAYAKSLKDARSRFYSSIINSNPRNSRQLFSTINHLLQPQTTSPSDATVENCNNFMNFFRDKIITIRSLLSSPPSPSATFTTLSESLPGPSRPLRHFSTVTLQEVEAIITKMKPSTCVLDPLPTVLVKSHLAILSPLITQVINLSLQAGHVPPALKNAVIRPLLKKHTLDPDQFINYRPISNLPFLSKVLEKVVASQLHNHLKLNSLYETFQSGFRQGHSTETALVRVTNDLLMTADAGSPSILILLDLSAAFDTVDHNILLHRLHTTFGLSNSVYDWFSSFLSGRTEYVALGKAKSDTHIVTCGVPQGSVLGPTLFTLYLLPLGRVISTHGLSFHCYADDTQLYLKMDFNHPNHSALSYSAALTTCLEDIKAWMKLNFLQLNSSKTEAILVGTPHQVSTTTITSISFSDQDIPLSSFVTNLGVKMDPHLTYDTHIQQLCKASFYHLRNIAKLRPLLTLADAEKLVHAFVSSRLDYCNALLIGIPSKSIQKLQYVQNSAARILMRVRKFNHITPILKTLHWLPVSLRIEYKVSLLTHQCLHGTAPTYLKDLLTPQTSVRSLRSSSTFLLKTQRTKLRTMGDRAFCSAAPRLWNALPDHLRAPQNVATFKCGLKTHLFKRAFHC
ncbi:uncharacterized protein [Paramormyrops kingsleyae]|uniref:uncharacterized protein n=1 Tax=Paramormyrops kingsleyae TaxID=1676925 RepID=UPI003B978BDF